MNARRPALPLLALLLAAAPAFAEPGWLSLHGRVPTGDRLEALVGTRSLGVGGTLATARDDDAAKSDAWLAELQWGTSDRTAELRVAHAWTLNRPAFASASAHVGATALLVPSGHPDVGFGLVGGVALSLGGSTFQWDFGAQTGAELFVATGGPRIPVRLSTGPALRLGDFSVALWARAGVDVEPGHSMLYRGEVLLAAGWAPASR